MTRRMLVAAAGVAVASVLGAALARHALVSAQPAAVKARAAAVEALGQAPFDKAAFAAAHAKALAYIAGQQKTEGDLAGAWVVEYPGKGDIPDVGISGLCAYTLAKSPDREKFAAHLARAADFILKSGQPDDSFCDPSGILKNYKTSIGILALTAIDPKKYNDRVIKARNYILSMQAKQGIWEGGFGYGEKTPDGKTRAKADLSNTPYALEALKASGLPPDHPAYKEAIAFIEACQNRSENPAVVGSLAAIGFVPLEDSENAGGLKYTPIEGSTPEKTVDAAGGKKGAPSSGSMTYNGLLSFIYAGVHKNDPRVQAAYDWIKRRYTLEENPGLRSVKAGTGKQGLYYYFHAFAKALDAYGEETLQTADGDARRWAQDLAAELLKLQRPDGSWVNENDRWMERDPRLVTAYGAMTMNILAKWLK